MKLRVPGALQAGRAVIASAQARRSQFGCLEEFRKASRWIKQNRIDAVTDAATVHRGRRIARETEAVQFISAAEVHVGLIDIEALVRSEDDAALVYPVSLTVACGGTLGAKCPCWGCENGMGKHGVAALTALAEGYDSAATTTTLASRRIFSRRGARRLS